MNPILKNILAVIAGIVLGSIVNMALVMMGHLLVPPPEGMNPMDPESLKAYAHLFESKHFIGPFIAHAAGTFAGAFVASKIAASHHMKFAIVIGVLFLLGGISMVMDLPSPIWFNILDLGFAYIPMAWLGWKVSSK